MTSLEQQYRWACYLYYRGTPPYEQSPWSDADFDRVQQDLGMVKTDAFALAYTLTDEEIEDARNWANGVL
jgi:hypothetical protein